MENKFSPKSDHSGDLQFDPREYTSPSIYNIRNCPSCEQSIYGMPGGRDAHCANCGYKDPCCSD